MPVFVKNLRNELAKPVRSLQGLAYGQAKRSFDVEKRQMLGEFNSHPVTVELNAGPTANSEFLDKGNLYSLLGFPAGQDPTEAIYDELNNNTAIKNNPKITNSKSAVVRFEFPVQIPTLKSIEDVAQKNNPLPWDGRSWVKLLENGIPGFMYYIFKKFFNSPPSFSTTGLQSKNKSRNGKIGKISYISEILNNFRKRMN